MTDRHRPRRAVVLAVGTGAQAATAMFTYGVPLLVPALRRTYGLSLAGVGLVVAAPTIGLLFTLVAWGALADRYGERVVMVVGLAAAAAGVGAAALTPGLVARSVLLGLAGAAGASVNAASGRMVLGWFAPDRRGRAMGVRQTAQPLGVALAAAVLPPLAAGLGLGAALAVPAVACAAAAVAVLRWCPDPPRRSPGAIAGDGSPYRAPTLWRLHGASTLLVVPQFAASAFSVAYLVGVRHWDPVAAGRLIRGGCGVPRPGRAGRPGGRRAGQSGPRWTGVVWAHGAPARRSDQVARGVDGVGKG